MPKDRAVERAAIIKAAKEDGVDPAYALAVAERESSFDPAAKSSKTIRGMYQMRGDLRAKYGVGDAPDAYSQAKGWNRSLTDLRADMKGTLGRDPTDQETYLGHHFGAKKAARTLKMDPSTPVEAIFTPQEMRENPHFARAGTIGTLNSSVMADIGKRTARFGGAVASTPPAGPADLSAHGEPVQAVSPQDAPSIAPSKPPASNELDTLALGKPEPVIDLSSFGEPVEQPQPVQQAAVSAPPDLSQYGTPV